MSIHVEEKMNYMFDEWLNKIYGGYGKVESTCGKVHNYLGVAFDLSEKNKVDIDMIYHMNSMVDNFITKLK